MPCTSRVFNLFLSLVLPCICSSCTVYVGSGVRSPGVVWRAGAPPVYGEPACHRRTRLSSGGHCTHPTGEPAIHLKHKKNLPDAGGTVIKEAVLSR